MGLRSALARHAVRRVHVLLVEVPGWSATRMRAERELRRRLWTPAQSPADADALLVCGVPGTELEAVCDRVWDQLPGPRARAVAKSPDDVAAALDAAAASLLDEDAQQHDSHVRSAGTAAPDQGTEDNDGAATDAPDHGDMDHGDDGGMDHGDDGDMDHGDMDHGDDGDMDHGDDGGMDHGDMNHSGMDHGGMDHSGMDMPMPGGIGLAEGGPDRDGLDLDVLNVPLGPVLPHWPAGLVLHCALQGDVITEAKVEVLNTGEAPPPDTHGMGEGRSEARERCVKRCDSAGRLLALSGAADLSARAFRIRDGLLEGNAPAGAAKELERLARQVKRSPVLAWSLKEPAGVWDALTQWLEEAVAAAAGNDDAGSTAAETGSPVPATDRGRPDSLAEQVRGLDLAAARLVVATVDMGLAAPHPEVAHGG